MSIIKEKDGCIICDKTIPSKDLNDIWFHWGRIKVCYTCMEKMMKYYALQFRRKREKK